MNFTDHLKILTICTVFLSPVMASEPTDHDAIHGPDSISYSDLPEFCVASFLVTEQEVEAAYWRVTYELDLAQIERHRITLERLLKDGHLEYETVEEGARNCILVRKEAENRQPAENHVVEENEK